MQNAKDKPSAMQASCGAVGPYLGVLEHLGWTSVCLHAVYTDDLDENDAPVILNFKKTCPRTILKIAFRRMHDIDAANCRVAKKIGGTPDFEPLGSITRGKALRFSPPILSLRAMDSWPTRSARRALVPSALSCIDAWPAQRARKNGKNTGTRKS